jgi:hypothetical protein
VSSLTTRAILKGHLRMPGCSVIFDPAGTAGSGFRAASTLHVLSGVNRTHDLRMMGFGLAVTVLRDTPSPPRGFKLGGMRGYTVVRHAGDAGGKRGRGLGSSDWFVFVILVDCCWQWLGERMGRAVCARRVGVARA